MLDKNKAKDVAIKEVQKRIVTIQEAKIDFKEWIEKTFSMGGFPEEVVEFWDEVIKQVDEI